MIPLKEDGHLDIECINKLPILDYMEVVGNLTAEQYKYYVSKSPVNESNEPITVEKINIEDALKKGWVDANEFLKKMRDKYEKI